MKAKTKGEGGRGEEKEGRGGNKVRIKKCWRVGGDRRVVDRHFRRLEEREREENGRRVESGE